MTSAMDAILILDFLVILAIFFTNIYNILTMEKGVLKLSKALITMLYMGMIIAFGIAMGVTILAQPDVFSVMLFTVEGALFSITTLLGIVQIFLYIAESAVHPRERYTPQSTQQ